MVFQEAREVVDPQSGKIKRFQFLDQLVTAGAEFSRMGLTDSRQLGMHDHRNSIRFHSKLRYPESSLR